MALENKTLILQTENVVLEIIQILENGWSQFYLQTENERYFLGAENFEYIRQHLLDALYEETQNITGFINSESVFWVLSLSEIHSSIYGNNFGENMNFYIQDKDANTKFIFDLLLEDKLIWKDKLKSITR